jgi:IS30 family transposase
MRVYTQLTIEERKKIYELNQEGVSLSAIACTINRSKSTVSREFKRNKYSDSAEYTPENADFTAKKRKYRLPLKVERCAKLEEYVVEKLKAGWSPSTISSKLKSEGGIYLSTESIYQYIYSDKYKHLELYKYLAFRKKNRN